MSDIWDIKIPSSVCPFAEEIQKGVIVCYSFGRKETNMTCHEENCPRKVKIITLL